MFDGILFDLDGTLWDATAVNRDAWGQVLARHTEIARPPVRLEEIHACMGLLRGDTMARLFPDEDAATRAVLSAEQADLMLARLTQVGGQLYPGVEETLRLLSRRCPLFLVSNCGDRYYQAFYTAHGLKQYFTGDLCAGRTGRPKCDNIAQVVRHYGLRAPLYVGDTALDCSSARAAGVPFLYAAYGFGKVEGVPSIASFSQLPQALEHWGEG